MEDRPLPSLIPGDTIRSWRLQSMPRPAHECGRPKAAAVSTF